MYNDAFHCFLETVFAVLKLGEIDIRHRFREEYTDVSEAFTSNVNVLYKSTLVLISVLRCTEQIFLEIRIVKRLLWT